MPVTITVELIMVTVMTMVIGDDELTRMMAMTRRKEEIRSGTNTLKTWRTPHNDVRKNMARAQGGPELKHNKNFACIYTCITSIENPFRLFCKEAQGHARTHTHANLRWN